MDRLVHASSTSANGFPRTRGDGPLIGITPGVVSGFPPHARGWTGGGSIATGAAVVSPARAGMDLISMFKSTERICFPRTRGDGPRGTPPTAAAIWFPPHARGWTPGHERHLHPGRVSPHARGWTVLATAQRDVGRVSPARAGMDLLAPCPRHASRGFPRTRGDGPLDEWIANHVKMFPPHARGWTGSPTDLLRGL